MIVIESIFINKYWSVFLGILMVIKSTLVQVMAWRGHWSIYCVSRPEWVNQLIVFWSVFSCRSWQHYGNIMFILQQCYPHQICLPTFDTVWVRKHGNHSADIGGYSWMDILKFRLKFYWRFVPKGSINNKPALAQKMVWHQTDKQPLSEPVMWTLLRHIYFTWPQWVTFVGLGCVNYVNTMAADDLAPCVARSSTTMILN